MLLALALIPAIVLLIVIYCCDRNEKEPIGLLIGIFFAGVGTIISALILELFGQGILDALFPYDKVLNKILLAFAVVGPAEELGKYLVTRWITWKSKHFNYIFDGIVYSVFASLGFAAFENVGYVLGNGIGTGILRMFTSVPGHMCFAVLMGFFYSKAKYAQVMGKKGKSVLFSWLAFLVPSFVHGAYDAVLFVGQVSDYDFVQLICVLLWIAILIALFVTCIILIVKTSRKDYRIVFVDNKPQTVYRPQNIGTWRCSCGTENNKNFCSNCGNQRPLGTGWYCPCCKAKAYWNFCGNCGTKKPENITLVAPAQNSTN